MFKNSATLLVDCAICSVMFGGCCALAQETPAPGLPGQAAAEVSSPAAVGTAQWSFTAGLDSYGDVNTASPATGINGLRAFDFKSDTGALNAASIGVEFKTEHFGFHFDGGYGDMFKTIASTDPWKGPNQYVMQGYVSYRPLAGNGLQFDFGKFFTSVSAEVPDTASNFNYSRSLAFTLGTPFYHFGMRATAPITKAFTAGVQLINGMDDVTGRNRGRMVGITSAYTAKKWAWNQVWIGGSENLAGQASHRNLADEVVTFSPISSIRGYFEVLYGHEQRALSGSDHWYGIATAIKWNATKKLSFSPRLEFYGDPTGFTSGTAQQIHEVTATADYKIHPLVTARCEFRRDDSDHAVFDAGQFRLQRSQETFLIGLLLAWKAEH